MNKNTITKNILEGCGFLKIDQLEDNIFYVREFLSEEDLSIINDLIDKIDKDSWAILNKDHHESWHNKFYDHNNNSVNSLIRKKISMIINNFPELKVMGFNRILRQLPGNNMDPHVDEIDDQANGAIREYAMVLYINDNYSGGELSFLNLNIKIKPEKGSLMIFKTGPKYLHQVQTVLGNNPRYCFPGFAFSSWVDN